MRKLALLAVSSAVLPSLLQAGERICLYDALNWAGPRYQLFASRISRLSEDKGNSAIAAEVSRALSAPEKYSDTAVFWKHFEAGVRRDSVVSTEPPSFVTDPGFQVTGYAQEEGRNLRIYIERMAFSVPEDQPLWPYAEEVILGLVRAAENRINHHRLGNIKMIDLIINGAEPNFKTGLHELGFKRLLPTTPGQLSNFMRLYRSLALADTPGYARPEPLLNRGGAFRFGVGRRLNAIRELGTTPYYRMEFPVQATPVDPLFIRAFWEGINGG